MAAVSAEGNGNRFVVIAVETSKALPFSDPGKDCAKIAFSGSAGAGRHGGGRRAAHRRGANAGRAPGVAGGDTRAAPAPANCMTIRRNSATTR